MGTQAKNGAPQERPETTCESRLQAKGMARGDQQVIDITNELWSGEWGPWNAPDRPTPKCPQLVFWLCGI